MVNDLGYDRMSLELMYTGCDFRVEYETPRGAVDDCG
jgi:hypothetical protein